MQLLLLYHKPGEEEKIPQGLVGNMKRGSDKLGVEERARLGSPGQPPPPVPGSTGTPNYSLLRMVKTFSTLGVCAWAEQTVPGKEEPSQPLQH